MSGGVVREEGLSREHLQEPSQSALQGAFVGQAVFVGFPAAEPGEQLHFGPLEADPQIKERIPSREIVPTGRILPFSFLAWEVPNIVPRSCACALPIDPLARGIKTMVIPHWFLRSPR